MTSTSSKTLFKMKTSNPKSAHVFAIPELLELILLSLPTTTTQQELSSIQTILVGQTVCNTWRCLVRDSTRIRAFCYLPTNLPSSSITDNTAWDEPSTTPTSIRHNPYISSLLLRGRRWGGAWPFSANSQISMYGPTGTPQLWSFFFEISRSEFLRFPAAPGPWREMLATEPPFRDVWCTVTSQMTGIDSLLYDKASARAGAREADASDEDEEEEEIWTPRMEADFRFLGYQHSKGKQKRRRCCEGGFTLGEMVDVVREMFGRDGKAEWVVLESVREDDVHVV